MHDFAKQLRGAERAPANDLKLPASVDTSDVLGALYFSPRLAGGMPMAASVPCLLVPMPRIDADESVWEIWYGQGELTAGHRGDIQYRHDAEVLFGVVVIGESSFSVDPLQTPLRQATELAYRQVFELLESLNFPYLFRFWNYIADINAHSFGLDRYSQFNLGRQDAFLAHGREVAGNVPAACALGFGKTGANAKLRIAFLAGRVMPHSIENPRQVSAYQYPPQYGPRSPTFSRATLVKRNDDEVLFISGTASIVGHATMHPSDVIAQTRETLVNIEAVIAEANAQTASTRFDLGSLHYKVYVRHAADAPLIHAELTRLAGIELNAIYLQADVCRQDLLLEIEATAGHALRVADASN